jgi:hypothetical protein
LIAPKHHLVRFLGKCHLASSRRFKRCLFLLGRAGGTWPAPAATATASDDETTASIFFVTEAHRVKTPDQNSAGELNVVAAC